MHTMKEESIKSSVDNKYDIGEQVKKYSVVDDDVDSSDEVDDVSPLFLGFLVDEPDNNPLVVELFPNKAGGTPTWLDPLRLPSRRAAVCDFCDDPLQFVLQINAPIDEKESAYHRTIFVFMCPSMACLSKDQHAQQGNSNGRGNRCVKVFRCQLPAVNPFYTIDNADQQGARAALCLWCNTWKGDQLCGGCKKVRYCSKKHQIKHWRSDHKDYCKHMVNSCQSSKNHLSKAKSNTLWPEYEIIFNKSNAKIPTASDPLSVVPGTDETIMPVLDCFEGDEEKQCWVSFQTRIANDSSQVLRCWKEEGKPLWPELRGRPSTADIPNCNYCGGSMRFEFQIMPQLLAYFKVRNESDSLDWATIAIYTCEASCDSSLVYKEEFPWVQLYSYSRV